MSEKISAEIIEHVLLDGDLSRLTEEQRLNYYKSVCESLGLNPLTKPFDYIRLDGKLVLYARKDATEQLRKIHSVSIIDLTSSKIEDVWVVTAKAESEGRKDAATGAVQIGLLKGTALANALMKAETKAKRRVTLSICGLGMLDESELENQTETLEVVERNVREATEHAQPSEAPCVLTAPVTEPLEVTEENYADVVVHIGKAEGQMLGKKVGELHPNIVEWLYTKWREKLSPFSDTKDLRLKTAVEIAYNRQKSTQPPLQAPEQAQKVSADTPQPPKRDTGLLTKPELIAELRERCSNLILTEPQACGYLRQQGVFEKETSFEQASEKMLRLILRPDMWQIFVSVVEEDVKPKKVEGGPPKRKGRSK